VRLARQQRLSPSSNPYNASSILYDCVDDGLHITPYEKYRNHDRRTKEVTALYFLAKNLFFFSLLPEVVPRRQENWGLCRPVHPACSIPETKSHPWTSKFAMSGSFEKKPFNTIVSTTIDDDDRELEALGYKPSFKREFSNLATVCFSPVLNLSIYEQKIQSVLLPSLKD
jgi:hypothetical protein